MSRPGIGRWTFCGVQAFPGVCVFFLVNDSRHSTRVLVGYDEAHPVVITVKS